MEKLTPKERREVYLAIAEVNFEKTPVFFCVEAPDYLPIPDYSKVFNFKEIKRFFPEFWLFRPKDVFGNGVFWASEGGDNPTTERTMALLFAAEMTKTAKS